MAAAKLVGHAIVVNSRSCDLGGFVEVIRPAALRRVLRDRADVRALVGHDPTLVIGRTTAGTLQLRETPRGLEATIDPPDTTAGRDVVTTVQRGDVSGMSFAFRVPDGGDVWRLEDGEVVREVVDLIVSEVSVVAFPAYVETSVSVTTSERAARDEKHAALQAKQAAVEDSLLTLDQRIADQRRRYAAMKRSPVCR